MALHPVEIEDDTIACADDGWEAVEEERCERRSSRRRLRGSQACDVERTPRRREPGIPARRLSSGFGYGGLGAGLVAIVLLVLIAGVVGRGGNIPTGFVGERQAPIVEHDRFADHDRDFGYAFDDYRRRFNAGTAWSDDQSEPLDRPWFNARYAWTGGGLLLLLLIIALAAIMNRSMFIDRTDD